MSLFQAPPPTSLDVRFRILGIDVTIHPLFWLIALLFGAQSGNIVNIVSWVVVIFVSILVHELGHSMAMRYYGQDSRIVLHGFGGLAIPTSSLGYGYDQRSSWQQIFISFAGPLAGFLLAALTVVVVLAVGGRAGVGWILWIIPIPTAALPVQYAAANFLVRAILWVNTFWGLINLLPVFPLDGGRISRELFILFGRHRQVENSLWLSVITGIAIAVASIAYLDSFFMAILFGLLAFQSYQALQRGF